MYFKSKPVYDFPDEWKILQGELNGKPISTRCRVGLESIIADPQYPFQIGIAVPLLDPTNDGLTKNEEAETLWKIEDKLSRSLEVGHEALHVMTITYSGMREFVFYASDLESKYFEEKVKIIESNLDENYILQFMIQRDDKWETYKEYSGK